LLSNPGSALDVREHFLSAVGDLANRFWHRSLFPRGNLTCNLERGNYPPVSLPVSSEYVAAFLRSAARKVEPVSESSGVFFRSAVIVANIASSKYRCKWNGPLLRSSAQVRFIKLQNSQVRSCDLSVYVSLHVITNSCVYSFGRAL